MSDQSIQAYRDQVAQVAVRQAKTACCADCGHYLQQHGIAGCYAGVRDANAPSWHTCRCNRSAA